MDRTLIYERDRKKLALEHCRRVNAGDVDAIMELYGTDVTFADPVGWETRTGRADLREHFQEYVAAGIREVPGEPVAGQDGKHALLPITAVIEYLPRGPLFAKRGWLVPPTVSDGARIRWNYMLMLRVDDSGLIRELQAFWGKSDLEVIR
nr:nuclear transport factor 2 family protein [Micromonospora sp. DSM 115978]